MLKIAIVEDEEIIRMGLAYTVDWQSMGAQVMGEAADGVEVWRWWQQSVPMWC